jgi:hypothetical protein
MNEAITPKHVLLIWNLLFSGTEPKLSEAKPGFNKKTLEPLTRAGLIVLERRGRSTHLVLTERAWHWSAEHLDAPFTQSINAAPALAALLPRLKAYLEQTGTPLASLLAGMDSGASPSPPEVIDDAIRRAYLTLSGGRWETRVRLTHLREQLGDHARTAQDDALLRMQREGRLVLYPLDDPQDTFDADRAAALYLGSEPRHLVYMKG